VSSGAILSDPIISWASRSVSGRSRADRSFTTSVVAVKVHHRDLLWIQLRDATLVL
jgi:hypothetical protein